LDHRTCLICWTLHNRVFETDKKVVSHPNCRCTLVAYQGERLVTGDESFEKLEKGVQKQILGKSRFELFENGDLNLSDFIDSRNSKEYGQNFYIKSLSDI